jgi:hypothetical protein
VIKLKTLLEHVRYDNPLNPFYWMVKRAPALATQFGDQFDRVLGGGNNGVAFLLRSGKVMKITNDRWEVSAASRYRTKQNVPHLVSVYDVRPITGDLVQVNDRELQSTPEDYKSLLLNFNNNDWYAIIMDYVTPFDVNEKRIWDQIISKWYLNSRFTDEHTQDELDDAISRLSGYGDASVPDQFIDRLINQRQSVLSAFKRNNIIASEAHGGNIGWNKQGQLVHYDFWMIAPNTAYFAGPVETPRRLNKAVRYDASGIDTPNNPDM